MHRHDWVSARTAICCALWLFSIATALPLAAQVGDEDGTGPIIAVIDMQRILRESLAVTQMQQRIEELRQAYQAEFREQDRELRANDQELARERSNLSADDFAEKRQGEMQALGRHAAHVAHAADQRSRTSGELDPQVLGI